MANLISDNADTAQKSNSDRLEELKQKRQKALEDAQANERNADSKKDDIAEKKRPRKWGTAGLVVGVLAAAALLTATILTGGATLPLIFAAVAIAVGTPLVAGLAGKAVSSLETRGVNNELARNQKSNGKAISGIDKEVRGIEKDGKGTSADLAHDKFHDPNGWDKAFRMKSMGASTPNREFGDVMAQMLKSKGVKFNDLTDAGKRQSTFGLLFDTKDGRSPINFGQITTENKEAIVKTYADAIDSYKKDGLNPNFNNVSFQQKMIDTTAALLNDKIIPPEAIKNTQGNVAGNFAQLSPKIQNSVSALYVAQHGGNQQPVQPQAAPQVPAPAPAPVVPTPQPAADQQPAAQGQNQQPINLVLGNNGIQQPVNLVLGQGGNQFQSGQPVNLVLGNGQQQPVNLVVQGQGGYQLQQQGQPVNLVLNNGGGQQQPIQLQVQPQGQPQTQMQPLQFSSDPLAQNMLMQLQQMQAQIAAIGQGNNGQSGPTPTPQVNAQQTTVQQPAATQQQAAVQPNALVLPVHLTNNAQNNQPISRGSSNPLVQAAQFTTNGLGAIGGAAIGSGLSLLGGGAAMGASGLGTAVGILGVIGSVLAMPAAYVAGVIQGGSHAAGREAAADVMQNAISAVRVGVGIAGAGFGAAAALSGYGAATIAASAGQKDAADIVGKKGMQYASDILGMSSQIIQDGINPGGANTGVRNTNRATANNTPPVIPRVITTTAPAAGSVPANTINIVNSMNFNGMGATSSGKGSPSASDNFAVKLVEGLAAVGGAPVVNMQVKDITKALYGPAMDQSKSNVPPVKMEEMTRGDQRTLLVDLLSHAQAHKNRTGEAFDLNNSSHAEGMRQKLMEFKAKDASGAANIPITNFVADAHKPTFNANKADIENKDNAFMDRMVSGVLVHSSKGVNPADTSAMMDRANELRARMPDATNPATISAINKVFEKASKIMVGDATAGISLVDALARNNDPMPPHIKGNPNHSTAILLNVAAEAISPGTNKVVPGIDDTRVTKTPAKDAAVEPPSPAASTISIASTRSSASSVDIDSPLTSRSGSRSSASSVDIDSPLTSRSGSRGSASSVDIDSPLTSRSGSRGSASSVDIDSPLTSRSGSRSSASSVDIDSPLTSRSGSRSSASSVDIDSPLTSPSVSRRSVSSVDLDGLQLPNFGLSNAPVNFDRSPSIISSRSSSRSSSSVSSVDIDSSSPLPSGGAGSQPNSPAASVVGADVPPNSAPVAGRRGNRRPQMKIDISAPDSAAINKPAVRSVGDAFVGGDISSKSVGGKTDSPALKELAELMAVPRRGDPSASPVSVDSEHKSPSSSRLSELISAKADNTAPQITSLLSSAVGTPEPHSPRSPSSSKAASVVDSHSGDGRGRSSSVDQGISEAARAAKAAQPNKGATL